MGLGDEERSGEDHTEQRQARAETRRAGKPRRAKRKARADDTGSKRRRKQPRDNVASGPAFLGQASERDEPAGDAEPDARALNPYAPPKKKPRKPRRRRGKRKRYTPATSMHRFVNFVIDGLAIMAISFCLGMLLPRLGIDWTDGVASLAGYPIYFLYYVTFEALLGRTPGKYFTGTMVVDDEGEPPGWWTVFKRTLCRHVPFDALSFFGEGAYGWHDRWSGTHVVLRNR